MNLEQWWERATTKARNVLVAEYVMGWCDFWGEHGYLMGYPPEEQQMGIEAERACIPDYQGDISATWPIMLELRIGLKPPQDIWPEITDYWEAYAPNGTYYHSAQHKNPIHAILLLALQMKGVKEL